MCERTTPPVVIAMVNHEATMLGAIVRCETSTRERDDGEEEWAVVVYCEECGDIHTISESAMVYGHLCKSDPRADFMDWADDHRTCGLKLPKWERERPGLYRSDDGRFKIERQEYVLPYVHVQWKLTDNDDEVDKLDTLRDAKDHVVETLVDERARRVAKERAS